MFSILENLTAVTRIFLLFILLNLVTAGKVAQAADDNAAELANPFSDYVPFEDEYDIDEDERFMYFGRFFAVSLGTGMHVFTGNIGKLYNTAIPVLDFRLIYFFDFRLAGQFGVSSASHAFSAAPTGFVEVKLFRLNGDLKYYFYTRDSSATITAANPYIVAGVSQTFRTQLFQDLQTTQKDTALAISAGAGLEFVIKPRKTSIGIEGRMHQFYFQDRYANTYVQDGIPDTTGNMYSFITSLIFFF